MVISIVLRSGRSPICVVLVRLVVVAQIVPLIDVGLSDASILALSSAAPWLPASHVTKSFSTFPSSIGRGLRGGSHIQSFAHQPRSHSRRGPGRWLRMRSKPHPHTQHDSVHLHDVLMHASLHLFSSRPSREEWQPGAVLDPADTNPGPKPFSEPETRAFKQLVEEYRPTTFLTIHSGTKVGRIVGFSLSMYAYTIASHVQEREHVSGIARHRWHDSEASGRDRLDGTLSHRAGWLWRCLHASSGILPNRTTYTAAPIHVGVSGGGSAAVENVGHWRRLWPARGSANQDLGRKWAPEIRIVDVALIQVRPVVAPVPLAWCSRATPPTSRSQAAHVLLKCRLHVDYMPLMCRRMSDMRAHAPAAWQRHKSGM